MALTPFAAPGRSTPSTTTPLGLRSRGGQIKIKSRSKADQKRIKSGSKTLGRPGGLDRLFFFGTAPSPNHKFLNMTQINTIEACKYQLQEQYPWTTTPTKIR
jgi:hypothetical protein